MGVSVCVAPGSCSQYLGVTDSEREQNEVAAALWMHVHGYDWLSSGSNSEYVWDDESDESDGGWPTWY